MNKLSQSLLILVGLLAMQVALAGPARPPIKDSDIKLAMIDFSRLEGVGVKKNKSSAKPRKNEVLPNNCLKWNAAQINRRASKYGKHITKYSRKYNIDSNLVKAVITAESCFKRKALSSAGARGLMQLIPGTADRFGVKDSYNPEQNIRGGVKYLRFLFDRFKGDLKKIIAAYNAGEGAVDRYKGIPPYKETKQYVKNVLKTYDLLSPGAGRKNKRVKAVYQPPKLGNKPGRSGWEYNRSRAPHLYKR